jgi:hypothetical protein
MPTPWFVLLPVHLGEQTEHDRPRRLVLLQVDRSSPKVRVSGCPQNSPILSARSSRGVGGRGSVRREPRREGFDALAKRLLHLFEGHACYLVREGGIEASISSG